MGDVQGESNHNNLELKNIFNLLNPNSEGEIDIRSLNNLISSLDNLKVNSKISEMNTGNGENNDPSPSTNTNVANGDSKYDKKGNNVQQKAQNIQQQNLKQSNESQLKQSSNNTQSHQTGISSNQIKNQVNGVTGNREFVEVVELRYFPNNKTTLNFNEFCTYFNECMSNKELQDELLHNCFNQFDFNEQKNQIFYNEAHINSKKIKSIFEIFNDKTNQEEIQSNKFFQTKLNVLKFCGVSNDKMSYEEFKQFFEKNL